MLSVAEVGPSTYTARAALLVALLLDWGGAWSQARADDFALWPQPREGSWLARLGYHFDSQPNDGQHLVAPSFIGHYAFDRHWSLSAETGLFWIDAVPDRGEASQSIGLANPAVLGIYEPDPPSPGGGLPTVVDPDHRLRLALGASIPAAVVARGPAGRLQRAGHVLASGMEGLSRLDLWAPSRAAVVGALQLRGPAGDGQVASYSFEARPMLLLPLVRRVGEDLVEFFMPLKLEVAARRSVLEGGLALTMVWMPQNDVDFLQFALAPRARLWWGEHFVGLRYVRGLDEPLAGARGPGTWGLYLESGGAL